MEGEVTARSIDTTKITHLVMSTMAKSEVEEERLVIVFVGVVVCLRMLVEVVVVGGGVWGAFWGTEYGVLRTSVQEDVVGDLEMPKGLDDGERISFLETLDVHNGALETTTGPNNTTCSIWEALQARGSNDLNINSQPTENKKIINPGTT